MAIDAGRIAAVMTMDTSGFSQAVSEAERLMGVLADRSTSLSSKISAVGGEISAMGTKLTLGVSAALTTLGTMAVTTFTSFDDAMLQVKATMNATDEETAKLTDAAKEMGASTKFSATEASQALNYLALAGYGANDSIKLLPTILNLAQAGAMDLANASDMVTDAMSALGLEMSYTATFTDQMAKTAQKANTSVAQLGEGILTVGGTAKQLAGGTVELNAALGVLANNGIKGAEGGTVLRNVILSLTTPTDEAAKRLNALGVSVFDAEGNMRGINDIFTDLNDAMNSMGYTAEQRSGVLATVFNKTDLAGVDALISGTAGSFDKLAGEVAGADGACGNMAETMESGIGGSFRSLKSAIEGLAIEFGENLAPTVKSVAEWVTDLTRKFTSLDEGTQNIIIKVAAFTAAAGPVLIVLGKLVTAISLIASPIGLAVAAVAALVAGIAALAASDGADSVDEAWDAVSEKFDRTQAETMGFTINADIDTSEATTSADSIISEMYADIVGKLTDGLPDDPATVDELKRGVHGKFQVLMDGVGAQLEEDLAALNPNDEDYQAKYDALVASAATTKTQLADYEQQYYAFIDTYAGKSAATVQAHVDELQTLDEKVLAITKDLELANELEQSAGKNSYEVVRAGATTDTDTIAESWQYAYQKHKTQLQTFEDQRDAEIAQLNADFAKKGSMITEEIYTSYLAGINKIYDENVSGENYEYRSRAEALMKGISEAFENAYPEAAAEVRSVAEKMNLYDEFMKANAEYGENGYIDVSTLSEGMQVYLKQCADAIDGGYANYAADLINGTGYANTFWTLVYGGLENSATEALENSDLGSNPLMNIVNSIFSSGALDELNIDTENGLGMLNAAMGSIGTNSMAGLRDGISEGKDDVTGAITDVAEKSIDSIETAWDEHSPSRIFTGIGANAIQGLIIGINSKRGALIAAMRGIALDAASAARKALDINSPSRVMRTIGEYAGEGFALGIEGKIARANEAMHELSLQSASGAQSVTNYGAPTYNIQVSGARISSESDARQMLLSAAKYTTAMNRGYGA